MVKKLQKLWMKQFEDLNETSRRLGEKNPCVGNRAQEYYISLKLNHIIAKDFHGADARNKRGHCEYKISTCGGYPVFLYEYTGNGHTKLEHLAHAKKKVFKSKSHYYVRMEYGQIKEIWKLSPLMVWNNLEPKLERRFARGRNRLFAGINYGYIKKFGERIKVR
jgi:hypothetical protein